MKPLAALAGTCLALAAGVALWLTADRPASGAPPAELARPAPGPGSGPGADPAELGSLRTRVHVLEAELGAVRDELAALRVDRRAAEVEPAPADPAEAPAGAYLTDFSQRDRAVVLDIVESERQRIAAERSADRDLRAEQRLRERARRVAERAGLAAGQDEVLVALWTEERRREEALRREFRDAGYTPEAREALRDARRDLEEWLDASLAQSFGAELARDVRKATKKQADRDESRGGGKRSGDRDDGGKKRSRKSRDT